MALRLSASTGAVRGMERCSMHALGANSRIGHHFRFLDVLRTGGEITARVLGLSLEIPWGVTRAYDCRVGRRVQTFGTDSNNVSVCNFPETGVCNGQRV